MNVQTGELVLLDPHSKAELPWVELNQRQHDELLPLSQTERVAQWKRWQARDAKAHREREKRRQRSRRRSQIARESRRRNRN